MSTPFDGFVGPSYEFTGSKYAGIEKLSNWYIVANESGEEKKFRTMLAPSPGNAPFCALPVPSPFNQPNRGLVNCRGVVYGVNGTTVFSIDANGAFTYVGAVATDANPLTGYIGSPVTMVPTGTGQIFIQSVESGYVIPAGGGLNSLIPITSSGFLGATHAAFQDGYVLVISPHSNVFQISGTDDVPLGDATQWSGANVSAQAGQADYLRAIISSREYVHLFGFERSQIYQNVGNNGTGGLPFSNANSTFIETGIDSVRSLVEMGGALVWVGRDARGLTCWMDSSFSPQRISNFAIEQQWQSYVRTDDAIAFAFKWRGHLFYQITFPSAFVNNPPSGFPLKSNPTYTGATWVFDATVSQSLGRPIWHERQFLTSHGALVQRPEVSHAFCYGLHLVGSNGIDGNPGAIYQYSDGPTGYSDCAVNLAGAQISQQIVRDRVCPHVWENNKRIIYNRIEFELARGVGLDGSPVVGADPYFMLRFSNDGGNTFGAEQLIPAGKIGNFHRRAYLTRCGSARDRVVWVRCSDPVYWSFTSAQWDLFEAAN